MRAHIDLGACRGLYIKRFRKSSFYRKGCKIFAFEAHPSVTTNYGIDVTTIRKAAWIFDGELPFYVSKLPGYIQSSSVYREKRTGHLDKNHPIKIQCIDFSKWLKDNFQPDDHITLKCNIEGSEYDILEKMIADGTIEYIKESWIQWHWKRCGISQERHKNLIKKLNEYSIKQHNGYKDLK